MFENGEKVFRRAWPGLGVALYARRFATGERHEFPPQLPTIGKSRTITLLPEGLIRTWNENRVGHLDVAAKPGRIYGGLFLPGQYVIEALKPSTYICLAPIPPQLLYGVNIPMFELENITMVAGEVRTLAYDDYYRALICMYGECLVNGQPLTAGNHRLIEPGQTLNLVATGYCELGAYQEV